MKQFYLTLLFTSLSNLLFAQLSTIKGKVQLENGKPLSHVTIKVSGTSIVGISNDKGIYELRNVPFGDHKILVSSLEIKPQKIAVLIDKPKQNVDVTIDATGDVALDEVQIVGSSTKREIETQGFAVNVIETQGASLRSFQTNELLDRTVGVRVRQNGGLGSAVNYNLNGMSGNSVRIFVDGIPISTYGESFSLNSIPPALIERIEVYKGVIPAHLADDAMGGAINVILKKGMSNNLVASVSYGSFNTIQSNFSGLFRDSKSGLTVKASGFHNYSDNDYEVWGKFVRNILPNGRYDYVRARRFNDAYRSLGGQIELGFTDVKWADQFFIGYNGSDDYNEIQHGTYMTIPYKGRFTESQANVLNLNYRKRDFLTKNLEFTFNGMHSDRSQVVNDTVRWNYNWFGEKSVGLDGNPILRPTGAQQGAATILHIDRKVTTFRSGLNYYVTKNHRLVLNHIFYTIDRKERDDMRSAVEREFIGTRDLQKNVVSLAYEANTFERRLKTNLFGKYYQQKIDRVDPVLLSENGQQVRTEDRANSNKTIMGYGLASSYALNPTLILLVSAEKAVRMPSENEIFGSPGDNIIENVNIRPEISNNFNLGLKLGPYQLDQHRLSFSTAGFLRDTRDKIVQRINPRINDALQTNPYENLGKTKSIGFEAEINYVFNDKLNILFSASRFNQVFNIRYDDRGNQYDNYNKQLPNEPFFTINSMAQYTFSHLVQKNSSLNIYYNFGFVDRFYTTWIDLEEFRTPKQFIQDIGASYFFPNKKLVLSADAKNIFNRQVYDNFAVQKPGRAFYLKLNYTITNF
ncbi:TonB-dependent receptor plug domain-containing protein [Olivibacter sp. XZL3]|uniref:TonB-dependent receptor n=1 Tax=Olivibacter sp. XZL3 TaxID=1735116 RepID=UPI001066437A|nr:TonB-dependent receptor plug domain-containing protein [Olivibacter sp. XZL3]